MHIDIWKAHMNVHPWRHLYSKGVSPFTCNRHISKVTRDVCSLPTPSSCDLFSSVPAYSSLSSPTTYNFLGCHVLPNPRQTQITLHQRNDNQVLSYCLLYLHSFTQSHTTCDELVILCVSHLEIQCDAVIKRSIVTHIRTKDTRYLDRESDVWGVFFNSTSD